MLPKKTVNITWEDCKKKFTLKLTENDNCKRYDEYEYDRKRLEMFTVHRSMKNRSIHVSSRFWSYSYPRNVSSCHFRSIFEKKVMFTVLVMLQERFRSSWFGQVEVPREKLL